MSGLYMITGTLHLVSPGGYLRIMPHWLPFHAELVFWSGIAEIVLGLGLLFPRTRRVAAWGIIGLLVAVFPANIQMAIDWYRSVHVFFPVALLRLPLQVLLIQWAFAYAKRPAVYRLQRTK
jgi:uncharacterized membrane protein